MKSFLEFFVLIPLIGFLGSLFLPRHNEGLIAKWTFTSVAVHMISFQAFLVYWILQGYDAINLKDIVLYRSEHYEFFLDFYFDKITAVYIFVGSLLTFMVTMYSRTYLHREVGYKRFFNTILLFYLGYNLAVFSGNLETLFIGWEILGISSFLLIAFYRDRYLPRVSWLLVIMNHFWIALAISLNENFTFNEIHLYLIGVAIAGIVGFAALRRLRLIEGNIDLDQFHGHSYKHPKISMVFLLACLGATGFPITPTFIGEDLIFSHIHEDQWLLAFFTSLSFVVDGLAIIRIYARVFLGPHSKSVYEMAYRSS
jgi:NADH:ubiquinone oxidoreductase subunit 5 (subunit L)/multisubunit Na+/H+ antiporter MnhA subunit